MKIFASKNIILGYPIKCLQKQDNAWWLISNDDDLKEIGRADHFETFDEIALYQILPRLKGQLTQEEGTTINVDYTSGELHINPTHAHLGIPTNQTAKSNRQSNLQFSLAKWMWTYRKSFFGVLGIAMLLLVMAIFIGWFFYIPLLAYLAFKTLETLKIRDMFLSGDLCPALVIDAQKSKIAVLTDLTMGTGTYPIIRVKKVALPSQYRKEGQRIPVSGVYQHTESQPFWDYFNPLPIPSGAKSEAAVTAKMQNIPTAEWTKLKIKCRELDDQVKEGYYPIDLETTEWRDIQAPRFTAFGEEKK